MGMALRLRVDRAEVVLRGQDHFWRVMRAIQAAGLPITAREVALRSNEGKRSDIPAYLSRLARAGFVERTGRGAYRIARQQTRTPRLSRDGRQTSRQQDMWNVMRGPLAREGFTARDLMVWGSTDETPIALETAKAFIQRLSAAGYLLQLAPGKAFKLSLWRLRPSMNTGPLPPRILHTRVVWDQNRNALMGEVLAEEERP